MKEKHSVSYEYWNCTEQECNTRFIRRDYLYRHLMLVHRIVKSEARVKALKAVRGDKPRSNNNYYYDISDDESIYALLQELEDISDSGDLTDVDNFIDENCAHESMDVCVDNNIHVDDNNKCEADDDNVNVGVNDTDDSDSIIIISDEEENGERAVEIAKSETRTQTVAFIFKITVTTINGEKVYSNIEFHQDFYED